jgi:Ca2+-binding EF-hand superfamily protein
MFCDNIEANSKDGTTETKTENAMSEEELKNAIDAILAENDLNKDGFIDYSEFVLNQRAESNTS